MSAAYKRAEARNVERGDVVYLKRRWRRITERHVSRIDGRITLLAASTGEAPDAFDVFEPGAVVRVKTSTAGTAGR